MNLIKYCNFLKLGFDLRKYRLQNYGVINYDDPEVYLLFKDSDKYYYASYYGLVEDGNVQYDKKIKLTDDVTDKYNLKSYINFNVSDKEYNKMIKNFNSVGKYLVDNIHSINVKSDTKNGYLLINNYTKNDVLPPPEKKRYTKEHIILLIYILLIRLKFSHFCWKKLVLIFTILLQ